MHEDSVAIVGAACRLPGAANLDQFWDVLASGRDVVTEIPDDRWAKDFFYHPKVGEHGASYTWAAGVLGSVDRFDAEFFGISPREAEQVDPQQRLLLELTWEALEDFSGIPAAKVAGGDCGVFVGASSVDYGDIRTGDSAGGNAYFMTGVTASILANRISYQFDLHGPSFTVDTACSSSLVALDLACRDIRSGRIPLALVGGVNLLLAPYPFIGFCRATMLSPTGRCYAFDARANGYVRAEGGGVVVLKPLSQALRDGDRIRAVILGTGANSDGRTTGLSLPSRDAQSRLLTSVYEESSISPEMLAFIEAHGTGTAAGDPIELGAIGETLGTKRSAPLPVGSAKTNIGHLEPASGMAGLLKAMLSLEHRLLPPSLHFETPNPNIPFGDLNLAVATCPIALAADGRRLVAGVNSFGFGGANAHAILGSAPASSTRTGGIGAIAAGDGKLPPLLLSARSQAALKSLAGAWADLLPDLDDGTAGRLVRGAARLRDHHKHRLAVWGDGSLDIADRLQSFAASPSSPRVKVGEAVTSGKVAFVYSGNGVQRPGMARGALAGSAVFRETVAELDLLLRPLLGWSVLERLGAVDDPRSMARTDVAQPLLFVVQVGITMALRANGIEASCHAGHSVGEIAAAWASGALSLADACKVIVVRSRQQQRSAGLGGMAALGIGEAAAGEALRKLCGGLELAAINSSRAVTVAGPGEALARLEREAAAGDWRYTRLDIDYPFHSAALDFIRDDLIGALDGMSPPAAGDLFVSTVEGGPIPDARLDGVYWWRNIREPVRFADAIDAMIGGGARVFIEIGPHPALLSYIRDGFKSADVAGRAVATLTQGTAAGDPFPAIAAECHVAGANMSTASMFDGSAETHGLPSYPWQRERYWFPLTQEGVNLEQPVRDHPLLGYRRSLADWNWTNRLGAELQPWLGDHRLEGVPVVPGAAMLEIAAAVARARFPGASSLEVSGLEIPRALVLEAGIIRTLAVRLEDDGGMRIESRVRFSDDAPSLHAVARIAAGAGGLPSFPSVPPAAFRRIEAPELYRTAERLGLNYGPSFRTVRSVSIVGDGEALVTFDPSCEAAADFLMAPTFFDGALQGCLALLADRGGAQSGESFIPSRMGRVRLFPPYGRQPATARIAIRRPGLRSVSAAIDMFDQTGAWIASAEDCWFQRVRLSRQNRTNTMLFRTDHVATLAAGDRASPLLDIGAMLDDVVHRIGPAHVLDDSRLLFGAYLAARCHDAVKTVCSPGRSVRAEALIASGAINEQAAPLLGWMLRLMEAHGVATWSEDGWQLGDNDALPGPDVVWRTILSDQPELAAELAIAASTDFARLLRGGAGETTPPASIVEHMLYASPSGRSGLAALCGTILEVAETWPAGRPLRLLEIGAGAGILARRLMPDLARKAGTLVYVASDSDSHALPRLTQALARFDGARAVRWDPRDAESRPPDGQFDLVVSLYDFSRQGPEPGAIARVREVLAPGGLVLTLEPESNPIWDCAFGREAGWWNTARSEAPSSRIAGGDRLSNLLRRAGFGDSWSKTIECGLWPVSLVAARRSADDFQQKVVGSGSVVIMAGAGDAVQGPLGDRLADDGFSVRRADPAGNDEAFVRSDAAASGSTTIVFLPPAGGQGVESDAVSTARRLAQVVGTVRQIRDREQAATLWIVTHDAQAPSHGIVSPSPSEAALWGLGRTFMNELPGIACRLIDLPAAWAADHKARVLAAEMAAPDLEREIMWSDSGRFVPRLRRGLKEPEVQGEAVTLDVAQPGLLDTLCWCRSERRSPGPGEILITTHAAGLNFRDVMWAMALLPEEALQDGFAGPTLGLECAGVVEEIGMGVEGFAVGDRVMAMAPAGLASRVITASHAALKMPEGMSFAAAATLPVASLTVLYSLDHLARLQADEWVLIHGAAGGVGLMAIQYAQHKGATVIATAGSEAKRAFLRHLGVDHVLDSRSLAFADEVRSLTAGRGVDVVLNSLSGEAMERSLALLKPFGRFIELGKRDFMMDTRVGLRALRQNIAYHAVDIDRLPLARPELAAQLLQQAVQLVEQGVLQPLPHRVYPFADAAEAFRLMQGAGHIGKIVLEPDGLLVPAVAKPMSVRDDRTYLVTGGLSGFGLATAQWLTDQGARHFALLGRRGADTEGAQEALADLRTRSVDARAFACDVADSVSLAACLAEIRSEMPPLAGVFHAAAVIDDGLAADLTPERIETVLRPKLDGATNLDRLTRADEIELFVLFSSATTVLGAPGQGSYVAANMALEAIAHGRAIAGLPATAVAFGPIADVGMLAERADAREQLLRRLSTAPMPAREALDMLPLIVSSGRPVVALAPFRWNEVDQLLPILKTPMFGEIGTEARAAGNADLRARLEQLDPDEAKEMLVGVLTEEAARILAFSPDRIDPDRPLAEFGMDSLMAVELRLAIEVRLGIDLPLVSLSDEGSLSTLATRIARNLSRQEKREPLDEIMAPYITMKPESPARPPAAEIRAEAAE